MTPVQKEKVKKQSQELQEFENFKLSVESTELEARFNEAMFKKMDFYIKASEITPKFLEVREAETQKFIDSQKEQADELAKIMESHKETPVLVDLENNPLTTASN
jgi:hypothetical protein